MTRTINVASTAAPAAGKTISSTTYRLLAADGVTLISAANPPYVGVTDSALKLEQTVNQSDGQQAVITRDIPGRVTNLAATNAAAPVLTWTDIGGETSYEIHRGAAGFTPDVAGHSTRVGTAPLNGATFTDTTVTGNGATVFAYRVVALAAAGYTIGNEATCTPAAGGGGGGGPVPVQGVANASQSQTYPLNMVMPGNVTAGNRILVFIKHSYAGTPPSVTDSQGNTYTKHVNGIKGTGNFQYFYVFSAPVGATGACTLTIDSLVHGGTMYVGFALEVSGANGGFDAAADAQSTSSPFSTGPITTTAAGDLIISIFAYGGGTITPSGGATQRLVMGSSMLQTQIQASAGAISGAATGTGADFSTGVECSIAAFKAG